MPLLPQLKPIFLAQGGVSTTPPGLSPMEMRAMMHAMIEKSFFALAAPQAPLAIESDLIIPVLGSEIRARLYRGKTSSEATPAHIYFHGGGFFLGTLDHSDNYCRALARAADCIIVSVEYRLAPEYKFPTAPEDAFSALCWIKEHADTLGINPARLSVGGGSAGGNLAAVVAQMARDRHGPNISAQVLEIPVTDFTSKQDLHFADDDIFISSHKEYASIYLRNDTDAFNPMASPLLASTLENLPPALVICAEYDQLQPEGEAYADRLASSGVETQFHLLSGQFHGSQGFDTLIPDEAKQYRNRIADFLYKHLHI